MENLEALWNKNPHVVKVWNDNEFLHGPEKFKDDSISIPSGKFIYMDINEARGFLSQYWPMQISEGGEHMAEGFKKLRIEYPEIEKPKVENFEITCNRCGFKARSKDELDGHVLNNHLDEMEDSKVAESIKKGGPKK